ncbi:hypothetical protein HF521_022307 [Silurus meridionalis]|uniref:GAIN-B domain-containing protein n=1 Tax=Silurus meridionalis TaxID=175797 RepID=A0A8T0BDJ9_SILME|nr:hypothetical protein HF521_022307 [Silurus meridionalis]
MTLVKFNMMKTTDDQHVKISAPKLSDDDPPIEVFVPIEAFLNVSKEQAKIGVVSYISSQHYIDDSSTVLMSKVIRVEALGRELKDLSNRLVIHFPVNRSKTISETQTLSCQFYNETEKNWDDRGSFTSLEIFYSNNTVICSYDHMTPFAVLLVDMKQIDPQQWKILSYLTYIGCSLSSFISAVTIFLYVFMKIHKLPHSVPLLYLQLPARVVSVSVVLWYNEEEETCGGTNINYVRANQYYSEYL